MLSHCYKAILNLKFGCYNLFWLPLDPPLPIISQNKGNTNYCESMQNSNFINKQLDFVDIFLSKKTMLVFEKHHNPVVLGNIICYNFEAAHNLRKNSTINDIMYQTK